MFVCVSVLVPLWCECQQVCVVLAGRPWYSCLLVGWCWPGGRGIWCLLGGWCWLAERPWWTVLSASIIATFSAVQSGQRFVVLLYRQVRSLLSSTGWCEVPVFLHASAATRGLRATLSSLCSPI